MKGDNHNTTNTTLEEAKHSNMFSLHHHHHHQQFHQHNNHHHHQQQLRTRECHGTPEEDESRSSGGGGATSSKKTRTIEGTNSSGRATATGGDGATIEVVRRPRGRPPGSKNKPKPPVIITRDTDHCAMRPNVLELPSGVDIVEAIVSFARQRNVGLCVLSGTGSVANVSLRQPSTTPGATVTFHGRFDILSISASYLPPQSSSTSSSSSSLSSFPSNVFSISLAGPQGQIFGGSVIGTLIAASTVYIVVTTFSSPSYHRLPIEEVEGPNSVTAGGGSGSGGGGAHQATSSDGDERAQPLSQAPPGESCGMSLYSCHVPSSDVIWVPTARQPPPPF